MIWKRILMVAFVSVLLAASSGAAKYNSKVSSAARATTMAWQTTCSCGVDCGSNTCTFDCEGSISGCISCVSACCRGEFKRTCGIQP